MHEREREREREREGCTGDVLLAHSDQVLVTAALGQASDVEISTAELATCPTWHMAPHVGLREGGRAEGNQL